MTPAHVAACLWFGNVGALAFLILRDDIRHNLPRIVAALKMER